MQEKRFITMRHFEIKKKSVPLGNMKDSLLWLCDQQTVNNKMMKGIEQYNQQSLFHNYTQLKDNSKINHATYNTHMKNIKQNPQLNLPFNKKVITVKYNHLLSENIKNLTALKTFLEISLLENPIQELSQQITQATNNFTNNISNYHQNNKEFNKDNKDMRNSHQSDMLSDGVVKSWEWVESMVRCAIIHIKHASKHCQYHNEIHSLIQRLKNEADHVIKTDQSYNDSCSSALRLADELLTKDKEMKKLTKRLQDVVEDGIQIVPIRLRTTPSKSPLKAVVTCDYTTSEISLKEGDEVDVVDRSNLYKWGVVPKDGRMTNGGVIPNGIHHDDDDHHDIKGVIKENGGRKKDRLNEPKKLNGLHLEEFENGRNNEIHLLNVSNGLTKVNGGIRVDNGEDISGKVVMVPSILFVVAGTDDELQDSIDVAYKEHDRMVERCMRLMGGRLIRNLMQVFKKKYSHVEELLIQTLKPEAKEDLLKFFMCLEKTMEGIKDPHFQHEKKDLKKRLDYLTRLITTHYSSLSNPDPQENGIRGRVLVIQLNTLRLLLENFETFSETCKRTKNETSKMRQAYNGAYKSIYSYNKSHSCEQDDLISVQSVIRRLDSLIARSGTDAMQVQYSEDRLGGMSDQEFLDHIRDLSNFVEDIDSNKLTQENQKLHFNYANEEEINELIDEIVLGKREDYVDAKVSEEEDEKEEVKISEAEHMYAAESEENKKFVITSVIDPDSKQKISLAEAIESKIVDAENGTFLIDRVNMTRIPIAAAMAQNLIKVQSTVVKKTCERKLSVGVVTIKTTHHVSKQRKQTLLNERSVLAVLDLKNDRRLSCRQAVKEGLITKDHFVDNRDNSIHSLDQAELKGWIKRSRVSSPSSPSSTTSFSILPPDVIPEVKTTTYAVKKVMDRRSGKMLSFIDACSEGLIEKDSALYFDLLSVRKHSIEEAIQLGYVHADEVDDVKSIQLLKGSSWL